MFAPYNYSLYSSAEAYLEQTSDDLAAYGEHAGRRVIREEDMILLLKRCVLLYIYLCMAQIFGCLQAKIYY